MSDQKKSISDIKLANNLTQQDKFIIAHVNEHNAYETKSCTVDMLTNTVLSSFNNVNGDLNISNGHLKLTDTNFIQTSKDNIYANVPYVECFADRNSFLQAEEAFDEKSTTYGYACTGSKGYCVLSASMPIKNSDDGKMYVTFTLSGTPDDELIRYVNCATIEDRQSLLTRDGNNIPLKTYYDKWSFTTTDQFAQCFEMPYGITNLETTTINIDFNKFENGYIKDFIQANTSATINAFILTLTFDQEIAQNSYLSSRVDETPEAYLSAWYFDDNGLYTVDYPQIGNQSIYGFYGNSVYGGSTEAIGKYSHVEGRRSIAIGRYSHAEGSQGIAGGLGSHAEGTKCQALGNYSHAEGNQTRAIGLHAHSEGQTTKAYGKNSHAEGYKSEASGVGSHAEGGATIASNEYAHAEGRQTTASGKQSHAEGYDSIASGESSHAEGISSAAKGEGSHAEGYMTTALTSTAHAEGYQTIASGNYSHSEGISSIASGSYSHLEGYVTVASGDGSHAGGYQTVASGNRSFAHGSGLSATNTASIALGCKCNASKSISFVWNGDNNVTEPVTTTSNGQFKINPKGGYNNFYIGENNFMQCVALVLNDIFSKSPYLSTEIQSALSNYINI